MSSRPTYQRTFINLNGMGETDERGVAKAGKRLEPCPYYTRNFIKQSQRTHSLSLNLYQLKNIFPKKFETDCQ